MQDGVFGTQLEPLEVLFQLMASHIPWIASKEDEQVQIRRQMVPSLGWSLSPVTIYFISHPKLSYLFLILFLISLVSILPIKSIFKLVI